MNPKKYFINNIFYIKYLLLEVFKTDYDLKDLNGRWLISKFHANSFKLNKVRIIFVEYFYKRYLRKGLVLMVKRKIKAEVLR